MNRLDSDEIDYHAARILLLIAYCGSPAQSPEIKGRTLLAKLDFFLRYPAYLSKAALIRKGKTLGELATEDLKEHESDNVETRMIRYKYGPWDSIYYPVLAYLLAKGMLKVTIRKDVEYFGLTDEGLAVSCTISGSPAFKTLVSRAKVLKRLFPRWNGTTVKDFIYEHFPEIVSLPLGREI